MKPVNVVKPARWGGVSCHELFDKDFWNLTLNGGLLDPLLFLTAAGESIEQNLEKGGMNDLP